MVRFDFFDFLWHKQIRELIQLHSFQVRVVVSLTQALSSIANQLKTWSDSILAVGGDGAQIDEERRLRKVVRDLEAWAVQLKDIYT